MQGDIEIEIDNESTVAHYKRSFNIRSDIQKLYYSGKTLDDDTFTLLLKMVKLFILFCFFMKQSNIEKAIFKI